MRNKESDRKWRERNIVSVRAKSRLARAKWRAANLEKSRELERMYRRRSYGVLDATGERRTGHCELCGKAVKLFFDHDHANNKFRGWLCNACNVYLGWLERLEEKIEAYRKRTL